MALQHKPVCLKDFEEHARLVLPDPVYRYYSHGFYPEQTLRDNEEAFKRYRLRPRLLRDVSKRDMRTTMLGQDIAFPIAVAPTSMHCLAHNDGELATARAVGSVGTGMILSAGTNSTMEDVAAALFPNGLRWAQLYIFKDLSLVRRIVKKAETNGYGALVVTIDYPVSNKGPWGSLRIPPHIKMANFADVELSRLSSVVINESVTWKDIDWLHSITSLPIVLKGIRTGEMAREALNHNIAGIVVSNTGGRNLDGLPATGEAGARTVLEIIRDELSLAMALSGCPKLSDITPDLVIRDLRYSAKL